MLSTKASQSPATHHLLQLLKHSINNQSLKLTQQTHARICSFGLHQNPIILTNLINAYSHSKNLLRIQTLFDSIEVKDACLWNTLINAYVKNDLYPECFSIFNNMCRTVDYFPDAFTFSTLAKVSGVVGDLLAGKWIHGKSIKLGFFSDNILTNSLMSMYSKCDRIQSANKLFDEMPQRTVSSWNIMFSGYLKNDNSLPGYRVWDFVNYMLTEGLKPNEFTLSNLLPLCESKSGKFDHGREIHCYIIRNEMNLDVDSSIHLNCCLIDMYSRLSKINLARLIFDRMRIKNVFVWTAMLNCYLQNQDPNETVVLFHEMLKNSVVEPNEVSILTVLPACTLIAGLLGVKQIHVFCIKKGFLNHTSLSNSLIDIYSKNGVLSYAKRVFDHDCVRKDAISWSCMISGYGLHGKGQESVNLYNKMLLNKIKPDAINVVGVLSACSRSGLVEKGLEIYNKAISVYKINQTVEMCSCVVDLLARSGQVNEALTFIKSMPSDPGPSVWGALVSGLLVNNTDYELKVLGYKSLIEIESENASNYVSLSNLYASYGNWDFVGDVRRMMKDRNLRKVPGCSWITVNCESYSFLVGDKVHPESEKIYEILNELILVMKRP